MILKVLPLTLDQEHELAALETKAHEARKRHDWDAADEAAKAAYALYDSQYHWEAP